MGTFRRLNHPIRWLIPFVLLGALATSSHAAVTVSDVSVALSGGGVVLTYRLNRAATSVTVQVGSQSVNGPVAAGLNSVNLPLSTLGQPATITATAPAENGAGGATVLVPFTQDPASNRITGIDTIDRAGSPLRDHIYVAAGFAQAGQKKLFQYASDGTLLATKDLNAIVTSGSWPFGMAVAQNDPNDYVYVANRSARNIVKFLPSDLSVVSTIPTVINNYVGMSVTPNNIPNSVDPWSIYLSGNRDGSVWHSTYNGDATVTPTTELSTANSTLGTVYHGQAVAVDPTNAVMFKVQVQDTFNTPAGPIGALNGTDVNTFTLYNLQKWVSTDGGDTWVEDVAWSTAFVAAVGGDATAAAMGVALDKGFSAANLAASHVWVSVASTAGVNKLYHANASTGQIIAADTIDLKQLAEPAGSLDISNHLAHYLAVDRQGNIALTVNDPAFMGGTRNDLSTNANFWGVIAPNTAGPTTDVYNVASLQPVLSFTVTSSRPSVGNTGQVSTTITAVVSDPNAQAGSAVVTGNLSAIGGPASFALNKESQSADNKQATYSATYLVPNTTAAGNYDLPFTMTLGSESRTATLAQGVYNALVPVWTQVVDAAVTSSPVSSGTTAYIGTAAGSVYALNAASGGAPVSNFGVGGKASVGGAVTGHLVLSSGRLYVPTANGVVALDPGTGALLASSPAIANPSIAVNELLSPGFVFVASSDGKIYKLNAATLAQASASTAQASGINNLAVGPSLNFPEGIVVAGTAGGAILALKASDLTPAFANAVIGTDSAGAVMSNPVFTALADATNVVGVGGASGFWGFNADTGEKLGNGTDVWGTIAAQMGNPYAMDSPVSAWATSGTVGEGAVAGFVYASTGDATSGGQINILSASNGQRVSFGGLPIPLTPVGAGVSPLGGVLYLPGTGPDNEPSRRIYVGSDGTDARFFAVESAPQDFTYSYSPAKVAIFDPKDTATFPNYAAGGFTTPVVADNVVVAGSSAARVYGFPLLIIDMPPYVSGVTPASGASGVPVSQVITVTFNKAIDINNVLDQNVQLLVDGQAVPVTLTPAGDSLSMTITPNSPLQANKTYTVIVNSPLAQPFTSTFFTGVPPLTRADAARALQIAGGLATATAADLQKLDRDGDQRITVIDATRITRQVGGL